MISTNGTINRNGAATPADRTTRHRNDPTIGVNESALVATMVFALGSVAPLRSMLTRSMFTRTDHQAVVDLALIELDSAAGEGRKPDDLMASTLYDRLTDPQLKPHLSAYDAEKLISGLGDTWDCDVRHRDDRTGYLRRIVNELHDVQRKAQFGDEVQRLRRLYERGAHHDELAAQVEHLHAIEAERVAAEQEQTGVAGIKLTDLLTSDPAAEPEQILRTGLALFDRTIGGIGVGEKIVVSAIPGGGKTSLVSQLTASIVETNPDLNAIVVLCEETPKSWRNRLLVQASGLSLGVLRRPWDQLSSTQAETKRAAIESLWAIGNRVHFTTAPVTPSRIEASIMAAGAQFAVIDYVQLLQLDGEAQTRRDNIDGCIAELTRMSQQHGCTMLWVSNLAKPSHGGRRCILTAAKESSEISYAADVFFTGERVNADGEVIDHPTSGESTYRIRWRCLKNRRGPVTDIPTLFRGDTMRFEIADTGGVG